MKTIKILGYLDAAILGIWLFSCSEVKTEAIAISSDGVEISFAKKGSGTPGIIFIHGWSNQRTIWSDQLDHFSNDYTAIALDLAGSGKSGNNRSDWTIEAFSNDVIAVLDKLKLDKVVLVGFSMGALVAVETANQVPDRILGVVVVNDLKNPAMQFPEEMVQAITDNYMALVTSGLTNENLVAGGFYKRNEEKAFKRISEMYDSVPKIGWKRSLTNYFKWMNESQKTSLMQLEVPYVGIFSDTDPVEIDTIKTYMPSFKADIIANTGHVVFWDAPEEFNAILEKNINEFTR